MQQCHPQMEPIGTVGNRRPVRFPVRIRQSRCRMRWEFGTTHHQHHGKQQRDARLESVRVRSRLRGALPE